VLLCLQQNDGRIKQSVMDLICDSANEKYFSIASLWEVSIKYSIGKLSLASDLEVWMDEVITMDDLNILPILESHLLKSAKLPFVHRDPFDRLILAQSLVEGIHLLSLDSVFDEYRELLDLTK
jgi:PIN domain nuclease of toxin-antitoxin system